MSAHNKLNLVGNRFGRLTVEREVTSNSTSPKWYCKCDCGGSIITSTHNLRSGDTKSCGCLHREVISKDITGKRFGRLVAIKRCGKNPENSFLWECKCDCGKTTVLTTNALTSGNTRSCGCLSIDTQRRKMIEYNTKYFDEDSRRLARKLRTMKTRCYNPNYPLFKDYGGRGITICEEWLHDTYSFINWAKTHGYKNGLTIDRIDNNKGYSPDNCRWVSYSVQNNNKRNNRLFTIMGVTKSVAQWLHSLKMPKWYHKEIYSEPDHVIMHILLKRVHQIITENHFENVNDINEIIRRLDK